MIKNVTKFELAIGDRIYHFLCDMDTSIGDVKEALFQLQKMVGQIEDNIKAQQSQVPPGASPPSEAPKEDPKGT